MHRRTRATKARMQVRRIHVHVIHDPIRLRPSRMQLASIAQARAEEQPHDARTLAICTHLDKDHAER